MSLEQAYSLINERRKANSLERGLAAGLQAYENPDAPRHSGVGRIDQAALKSSVQQAIDRTTQQQQLLQDISAKQALGLPTPTGTTAAAYNYLRGAGQYPTNPILAGQPGSALTSPTISMPYETATKIGSPTQTETSEMAAKSPSKMPTVDYGAPNMPKPSPLNQAISTLGPMALAYKYLLPEGAKTAIGSGASSLASSLGLSSAAPTWIETSGGLNVAAADAAGAAGAEGAGFTIDPVTGAIVLIASQTPVGKNIIKGVGDVVSNVGSGIGNAVSSIGRAFGFAGGGVTGGGALDLHIPINLSGGANDGGSGYPFQALNPQRPVQFAGQNNIGQMAGAPTPLNTQGYGPQGPAVFSQDYMRTMQNMRGTPVNVGAPFGQNAMFAKGGETDLGDYSDGGRLLKGPGDGVSDSIPAVIGNKQPARLADGEFVVPARIVSELGNGSTQAGAKKLYAMMDRIQAGRKKSVGKGKVAVNSRADKHLPA